jgi:hypothetical protein
MHVLLIVVFVIVAAAIFLGNSWLRAGGLARRRNSRDSSDSDGSR